MAHSVLDLFIRQASLGKNTLAIANNGNSISYHQLDEASNKLCALLQEKGVRPGDNVPLVALRTIEFVIGLLAISKAGASYIPIDARYPEKRIRDITSQSNSKIILTSNSSIINRVNTASAEVLSIDNLAGVDSLAPTDNLAEAGSAMVASAPSDAQAIAYIIFTSGTTGLPKGVEISHAALLNLILWHNNTFGMDSQCRSTLIAGIGFDVAQWEIWAALASGATLYLPQEDTRLQPAALLDFFADNHITHAFVPTVLVPDVVSLPQPAHLTLRFLFTAGEKLNPVELSNLCYQLVDYYGPTEATIFATWNLVESARRRAPMTIGRAVADTEIFILDAQLQPVQGLQPGELFISGRCLAKGYLNNPVLTAEKFLMPAHFAGKRLYRSGDLARWLPDGRIQYLGRMDDQIKIRGNRVELGEIENVIMQVPGVKTAVAVATQTENLAEKKIIVFLLPAQPGLLPTDAVKAHLKETLPSYFMPADFQWRDHLPINANGKTDKAALLMEYQPSVNVAGAALSTQYETIAAIWRELLKTEYVAVTDNFFDIGGHSLLATKLAAALSERLGVKAYVRDIYDYPTLRALEQAMAERAGQGVPRLDSEPIRMLQDDVYLPADVCIDPLFDARCITEPRAILLTGATGFVGSHLLAELLSTTRAAIYCLVRNSLQEKAEQRLHRVLDRYQIALGAEQLERVHVVPGDVAERDFGMPAQAYQALSRQTDIIYHSASAVNFIQPYSYMKRDNVQGLREIIRFAAQNQTKPLVLLSTISVYSWGHLHTGKKVMLESDDIDQNLPAVITDIGYVRSKWVMEKIADLAASRGLPLMTFRLGYATSHSKSGISASYQWWGRLVQTCISSGTVPDLRDLREGLTTVDYMTRAIAHISRNPQATGHKFNLIHQGANNLTLKDFFRLLERYFDFRFRCLPFDTWLAQWEHDSEAPLYPLLNLFKDNMVDGKSTVQLYQDTYQWDCRNVKEFLRGSGIEEPRFTRQELLKYLKNSIGYTPLPSFASESGLPATPSDD